MDSLAGHTVRNLALHFKGRLLQIKDEFSHTTLAVARLARVEHLVAKQVEIPPQ
jgi:hypothetical protein